MVEVLKRVLQCWFEYQDIERVAARWIVIALTTSDDLLKPILIYSYFRSVYPLCPSSNALDLLGKLLFGLAIRYKRLVFLFTMN